MNFDVDSVPPHPDSLPVGEEGCTHAARAFEFTVFL